MSRPVRVALAAPLAGPLTYLWPGGPGPFPEVGLRVLVPLQNRLITGFILGPEPNPPQGVALKEVHRAVDEAPLFPAEMLTFFQWLADYYRHPLGQVLATALPVLDPDKPLRPRLEKAARIRPADPTKPWPRLGSAQKELLDYLQGKDWVPFRVLRQLVAGADGAGRSLAAKGLVEVRLSEIGLCPSPLACRTEPAPELTAEQAQAWFELEPALAQGGFKPFLLHGVTGSGKTELYLRAGQAVLEAGRTALILVPEIALTPALTARFQGRFGDQVAVLHSGLSPAERRGEWLRLLEDRARVALGARSAVFAPLTNLGLIVVDEEHEPSYKQEDGLRYQARDAALVRGRMAGATVLLGSATPAVVSFHHRRQGKYRALSLKSRVLARPMPTVEVVDLRQEAETPGQGLTFLSRRLVEATREALEAGQQVLYFLNRRGFASYPVCAKCGRPLTCPHCSVTLTYHAAFGALVCHYCGLAKGLGRCERCGQEKVKLLGLGTERVQAEAEGAFPQARLARLDSDVPGGYRAVAETLAKLERGEIDLLVGTQMLAKGHDFPGIGLVGVILADLSLHLPDFRAAERTFQLLTQVAGRAGRGERPGRVILQTLNPGHYSLTTAVAQDYEAFFAQEVEQRRQLFYPPFSRLTHLRLSGSEAVAVEKGARLLAHLARQAVRDLAPQGGLAVLGPAPAPVVKVKDAYRWRVLLKARSVALGRRLLDAILPQAEALEELKGLKLAVDVDPMSLM